MKVKLKETAPWETLPLKGLNLNKKEFVEVASVEIQKQIIDNLKKHVDIQGEVPIRRRRLKVTGDSTKKVEEKPTEVKEDKPILETSTIIEKVKSKDTKGLYKADLVRVLLERDFTKDEIKGINKSRLIDILEIDLK